MQSREYQQAEYTISTDNFRLELPVIHQYLSEVSYWAQGRTLEMIRTAIEHSLCFGVYTATGNQVGFARVVTDYATFAWLCDVFILDSYQGQGLGKWLVAIIIAYPELQGLKRFLLATRDAHELYRQYGGFQELKTPERWMERVKGD